LQYAFVNIFYKISGRLISSLPSHSIEDEFLAFIVVHLRAQGVLPLTNLNDQLVPPGEQRAHLEVDLVYFRAQIVQMSV
jgi:hypothetical protein